MILPYFYSFKTMLFGILDIFFKKRDSLFFVCPHYPITINFFALYSLIFLKKSHYSRIIILHSDPRICKFMNSTIHPSQYL